MSPFFLKFYDQTLELRCPRDVADDIAAIFGDCLGQPDSARHRINIVVDGNGRFAVVSEGLPPVVGLTRGDLPTFLMEEVLRALIVELDTAVALHAGAVVRNGKVLLLPGATGTGKSSLVAWLIDQGFEYLTDEIALLVDGKTRIVGFPRALVVKPGAYQAVLGLEAFRGAHSIPAGEHYVVCPPAARPGATERPTPCGLIAFPRFEPGADLRLEGLSAGAAALRLVACNLNARNLPALGITALSELSRSAPAVAVQYGSFDQLGGTIDRLARLVLDEDAKPAETRRFLMAFASGGVPRAPVARKERHPIPAATPRRTAAKRLTIGMATYDDYDGVYFTLQALRLYHPEILGDTEFVVIDNHPDGPCSEHLKALEENVANYRYVPKGDWSGTTVREFVFQEAQGDFALCVDSHVFIVPGALKRLLLHMNADPDTRDLMQGPLLYDNLSKLATHFEPQWQAGMYGHWATDERALDPDAPPFDIPMQGLGLFACRRTAWPGFNPHFRGFGGEEGYIHEKFRRNGGRTLCLPFLRWVHRFRRPMGLHYENSWEDRVRNYMIGHCELGLSTSDMEKHFREFLGEAIAVPMFERIRQELRNGRPPEALT